MSSSYTFTQATTFTLTHAKHMAARVAADLKRLQRFYGEPSDERIAAFEAEITELLKGGYLERVTYGFRRDGNMIEPTLRYTARDLAGGSAADDDPGRIRPGANVSNASFYSYLVYSSAWTALSTTEREAVARRIPISRGDAIEPGVSGYLENDRTYSAGGRALDRASVRSWG
jgi:hypothetical protein